MYESEGDHVARERRAQARGEGLRAALLANLEAAGPQTAPILLMRLEAECTLSEVAFQLERLQEEGRVRGERGGVYALA